MKKKGAALLSVVIIMTAALLLVTIIVDRSLKSYRRVNETLDDTKAYYFAESLVYDMAGYIDTHIDSVLETPDGISASNSSNVLNIPLIEDSRVSSYNVNLTGGIVKTHEDDSTVEYTYNVESNAVYNGRRYTVKVQMVSEYTKGSPNIFKSHRVNAKSSYRL